MKKNILAFVLFIVVTINASAQYKPFQFGLNITPSINTTKINCDNIDELKSKVSYNWGFKGNFYFVENYGFSTGFNILNLRGNYAYNNMTNDTIVNTMTCDIRNQYIEIPISMIMRTEKMGKARVIGNVGYGLGFCLNSNQELVDMEGVEIEPTNVFRTMRHSLIIKLGVEFNVYKSSCLTANVVYNNNFTNVYKDNPLGHNISLNSLGLEIGFMF